MRYIPVLVMLCSFQFISCAQESIPNREDQVAAATMAAPEDDRASSAVYGYDAKGLLVSLREGSNNLICVADDPSRPGFQSVCYHKNLQAFMDRGRVLRAEGKTNQEIFDIREGEAKSGALKMPDQATTLHLLEGKEGFYDAASGQVKNANYRYVVYIPWATAESTGLPLKPLVEGGPWIMDPGTHRAHIMITPPPQN
ncbi:MAG: hypothetical protein IPL46_24905 [Saprospiraceae bacterium]|nr:hypothetical protein [Saprospiraceae bacterium]